MPEFPGRLRPPRLAAAPATPANGELYYDTGTNLFYVYNGTLWTPLNKPPTRQVFSSGSGTYTTPAGCRAIQVECIGGGGGSGGVLTAASSAGVGNSGGGGQYAVSLIQSPAASYAYAVGAAGSAGAAGNNPGTVGGDTTFGATIVVAKGGNFGAGSTATAAVTNWSGAAADGGGVAPQSGGTGDILVTGGRGRTGLLQGLSQGSGSSGGDAAGPYGGKGGPNVVAGSSQVGVAGRAPGGGGGGSMLMNGGVSQAGVAGAAGLIVVTEYYS